MILGKKNLSFWLTIGRDKRGNFSFKITKGKPSRIALNQITVRCIIEIDLDWFKRPMFEANIKVPSCEFPDNPSVLEVGRVLRESGINLNLQVKDNE